MIPRNQKGDVVGSKKDFYKVLRINTDRVQRDVVFEELKDEMKKIPNYINIKRIQADEFHKDKAEPFETGFTNRLCYGIHMRISGRGPKYTLGGGGGEEVLTSLQLLSRIMVTLKLFYFVWTMKAKISFRMEYF